MQEAIEQAPRSGWIEGRQAMQTPEDVQAMLKAGVAGLGARVGLERSANVATVIDTLGIRGIGGGGPHFGRRRCLFRKSFPSLCRRRQPRLDQSGAKRRYPVALHGCQQQDRGRLAGDQDHRAAVL
jgi:hypothetical protein